MISNLETHTPLKKVNKYKWKFKTKPWTTLALQKYIFIKNNLLKKLITTNDPQVKERYHKEYKYYKNLVSTTLKQNKTDYCNHYLGSNWNSIKNTWKGVKSILTVQNISADILKNLNEEGTTISNPVAISNIFNNYFSSIAYETNSVISFPHKQFSDLLKNRSNNSFFVGPIEKTETKNVISLGSNK